MTVKNAVIDNLNLLEGSLRQLRRSLNLLKKTFVSRNDIREPAQKIARTWFENIEKSITEFNIDLSVITKYHHNFTNLLSLSIGRNARRISYIRTIDDILSGFKQEILLPVMKSAGQISKIVDLSKILENASKEEEEYLKEAIGCADHNFYKASIVLGWCAAVHRMHKVVEKQGLDEFNKKSAEMNKIKVGRYKRFNKSFNVHTLNDLRATVFDKDMLWVLEYWGLIDSNQHERLSICLTMRDNSAHPGEAQITPENLVSFYSDLKTIIFDNEKFRI